MYKFIDINNLEEDILTINNLSYEDLDVRNFRIDINQKCLIDFKNKLTELKDRSFFIVGDYDVDGISSTSIICRLLDHLEIKHNYYIPSRINEGYGLNMSIIDKLCEYNFDVLLCVDNGITAKNEIDKAKELGKDVLIIDHHEYSELPNADAIIHPNLLCDDYKDACAAGLCYLLSRCFYEDDYSFVLSGIASLADIVTVFKYNRYLIKNALYLLNTGMYQNINLLNKSNSYSYKDISFNVVPKINAVSRLGYNANKLVAYLLSDVGYAKQMIKEIEAVNDERKSLTSKMYTKANSKVNNDSIILVGDESFNEGLCGLVSARLTRQYNKPSIVLAKIENVYKGSARSTDSFNLYEYLYKCKDLFESFGGHDKALGLSISEDNYNKLALYLLRNPIEYKEDITNVFVLDFRVIDCRMLEIIESLMPFGNGFEEPLFAIRNNNYYKTYASNKYPKYNINDSCSAILFDISKDKEEYEYMIGKFTKDTYRKNCVSFLIEDLV